MPSTTTRIRTGYDTWVGDGKGRNPSDRRLRLRGTTQYGFLYLPLGPELRGATNDLLVFPAFAVLSPLRVVRTKLDQFRLDRTNEGGCADIAEIIQFAWLVQLHRG